MRRIGSFAALTAGCVLAALSAAAQQAPQQPAFLSDVNGDGVVNIDAFGDSITRGVGDFIPAHVEVSEHPETPTGEAGYPLRIEQRLGLNVSNLGKPGEQVVEAGVYRFAAVIPGSSADIVVIDEGTNDAVFQKTTHEVYYAVQAMINIARASGKKVVLATLPPTCCDRGGYMAFVDPYNNGYRELAALNEIPLADVYHAYTNTCGFDGCYLLNVPEGAHPNSEGYDVSSEAIIAALLEIPLFAADGPAQLETALGLPPGSVRTRPDAAPPAPTARLDSAENAI